jgi:tetratricopeptide (TPR) repeat protein
MVIGQRLSNYEVIESLGAGGMGEVYRARDTRLGRDVAIKVLSPERPFSATARLRFQREASTASALNHPNIITIYEVNFEGNVDYIVMECVRGATLSALLKTRRLTIAETLRYGIQIADAVGKAHSAGIVHRDLKPGNVMITEDGLVKVLDFGLAKFLHEVGDDFTTEILVTQPGTTTGTVAYMSPEQARGESVDARSDIFSLGIVLFQLLAGGELPFAGTNTMALLHNLHFNPPRDLGRFSPEVPPQLAALVSKMLQKEPSTRIQTMAEVGRELRQIELSQSPLSGERFLPSTGNVPVTPERSPLPRRFWWAAGLVLLVGVLVGGAVYLLRQKSSAQSVRDAGAPSADEPYAVYKRARELLDHSDRPGNIDRAIDLLQHVVNSDPNSAPGFAGLAEAYSWKNDANPDPQWMKLASEYGNRAVQLDGQLAITQMALGTVETNAGHPEEAEKLFRKAADLNPKSALPYLRLGVLYDKTSKPKQAVQELQHALKIDPNDWRIYMELGLNAYRAANYQQAATSWEQALKLEPDNVLALRNLGAVYHMLDRDDDAAAALQHAIEIQPNADSYNNLGTIRFYQGRYQDAVPAFEKTAELGANSYDTWGNLADAYRWTPGNEAKSKQAYQHAIQLIREEMVKYPTNLDLKVTLALYLAKIGDKSSALKELKPVERAHDKQASTLFGSAIVYELCGLRGQSMDALAAAVKAGESLNDIKNEPELVALRADPNYHLRILAAGKP